MPLSLQDNVGYAIWVLSPGPNRVITTSFAQMLSLCPCPELDDDIAFRIR